MAGCDIDSLKMKCTQDDDHCVTSQGKAVLKTCVKEDFDLQTTDCETGCNDYGNGCKLLDGWDCSHDACDDRDNRTIKKCGPDHKYVTALCPGDATCIKGFCIRASDVCISGNTKCKDDRHIQECRDGQWSDPMPCGDSTPICITDDITKLATCVSKDEKKFIPECEGNFIYKCSSTGELLKAEPCDDNQICISKGDWAFCGYDDDADIPPACEPKCKGYQIENCIDGELQEPSDCPEGMVCKSTKDGAACQPLDGDNCENGSIKCSDIESTPNQYFLCGDDGQWDTKAQTCPESAPVCSGVPGKAECHATSPAMQCKDKEIQCQNDTDYVECINGQWGNNISQCENGCDSTAMPNKCMDDTPAAVCNDGEIQCKNDTDYFKCINGQWGNDIFKCPVTCDSSSNPNSCLAFTDFCQKGEFRCVKSSSFSSSLEYCDGNGWKSVMTCESQTYCHAELGACVKACEKSACMTNDLFQCKNGLFADGVSCQDGCIEPNDNAKCASYTFPSAICPDGVTKCDISSSPSYNLLTCKGGNWKSTSCNLINKGLCISRKGSEPSCEITVCRNGDIQCDSNNPGTLMQCNNNKWITIGQCGSDFICKKGRCVSPL